MKFKNDKERIAFLEDYRNVDHGWYLWKEDDDLKFRMWRYDLPDAALIVSEQLRTFTWPDEHEEWTVAHWYIVKDWSGLFADQAASRTMALAELKRWEKEG